MDEAVKKNKSPIAFLCRCHCRLLKTNRKRYFECASDGCNEIKLLLKGSVRVLNIKKIFTFL